jgi:hypothetical protein
VGKQTEQMVARYLRSRGLAGVERAVRTGFRTRDRTVADAGDLTGWPGVCVQVKSLRPANAAERAVRRWLVELEVQRAQSGASVGLLVVRRWGTTDVGEWWCFLHLATVLGMAAEATAGIEPLSWLDAVPVRMELSDAVDLMQTWGWAPVPTLEVVQ